MNITQYLEKSYTAFHAVENAKNMLEEKGFRALDLGKKQSLKQGDKFYVIKNGSALIAFSIGDLTNYAFNIAESHTDSPALKVKGSLLTDSAEGKRINAERYGGLILHSMLDIPLKIAGRILCKSEKGISVENYASDFCVNIPSVAIHHQPEVNDKLSLNVQVDMQPLLGGSDKELYPLLSSKEIIDADLYCVPAHAPAFCGRKNEFLVSPRIDNLTSAFSSIQAIINANPKGVAVACLFDNEEIGSSTKQGACSSFLKDVLCYINSAMGFGEIEFLSALQNGFALSIDNGHAVHPAHPEKSDVAQKVYLNKGIVIKHHTNYSTDGLSSALIKAMLDKAEVCYQDYYNRSDLRCGGTLGLITSSQLAIKACDIGLAQLAMHSATETVGAEDINRMTQCVTAFFQTSFVEVDGGVELR